jgi:ELWxxDGT repeat protein
MARAFFSGIDAAGKVGLWITHGTAGSTHEITVNGAEPGGVLPQDITVFNHEAIFVGRDELNNQGLWVTNGTTAGTDEIINIGVTSNLVVFHNEVLFGGADAANNQGLWVTDGTAAGTHAITSSVSPLIRPDSFERPSVLRRYRRGQQDWIVGHGWDSSRYTRNRC